MTNTIMVWILSVLKGFFKAPVINSYFPKISKINDPLIPGSIMAVIAIIPQKRMNHQLVGVVTGIRPTIRNAAIAPRIIITIFFREAIFSMDFPSTTVDASIRPKNNDQVGTG